MLVYLAQDAMLDYNLYYLHIQYIQFALQFINLEPVSRSHCALLKLDFLTNAMHLLYALVRKSSFSKAQGLRETGSCTVGTIKLY